MPLNDVWGNSWLSSWNGHWKSTRNEAGDWGWPDHKRRKRWKLEQQRRDELRALIKSAFEPPSEAVPLSVEVRREVKKTVDPFLAVRALRPPTAASVPQVDYAALFANQRAMAKLLQLHAEMVRELDDEMVILLAGI